MDINELVIKQAGKVFEMEESIKRLEKMVDSMGYALKEIEDRILYGGGPKNGNGLKYNNRQLEIFDQIAQLITKSRE